MWEFGISQELGWLCMALGPGDAQSLIIFIFQAVGEKFALGLGVGRGGASGWLWVGMGGGEG